MTKITNNQKKKMKAQAHNKALTAKSEVDYRLRLVSQTVRGNSDGKVNR